MSDNDCLSRKWVDRELLEERLHNICRNTCQYAKKGVRPNVMCPLCWLDDIFKSIDELAVEQPMSAVEYLKQKYRMDDWSAENCNHIADNCDVECSSCPYDQVPSCTDEAKRPLEAITIVQKWAKEHPEEVK